MFRDEIQHLVALYTCRNVFRFRAHVTLFFLFFFAIFLEEVLKRRESCVVARGTKNLVEYKNQLVPRVDAFLRFVFTASDLDCIRALFNEKEKELSLAVAKVEELTRQLEELRGRQNAAGTGSGGGGAGGVGGEGVGGGGGGGHLSTPASAELEKLRRELIVSEQTSLSLSLFPSF